MLEKPLMSSPRGSYSMDRRHSTKSKLLDLAFDGNGSDNENGTRMMMQHSVRRGSESMYADQHDLLNSARHDIELPEQSAVTHREEVDDDGELVESVDPELFQAGIKEHARHLGIDPEHESEFLWIARESLVAPTPDGWHQHVTANGIPYYYNEQSGESRWDHPCDDQYRQLYRDMKRKKYESKQQPQQSYGSHALTRNGSTSYLGSDHSTSYHHTYDDYNSGGTGGGGSSNGMDQHSNYGDYKSNYSSSRPHQQAWEVQDDRYHDDDQTSQQHYYHHSQALQKDYEKDTPRQDLDGCDENSSDWDTDYNSARHPPSQASSTPRMPSLETELKLKEDIIEDLQMELKKIRKKMEQQKEEFEELDTRRHCTEESLKDLKTKLEIITKKLEDSSELNQQLKRQLMLATKEKEEVTAAMATATTAAASNSNTKIQQQQKAEEEIGLLQEKLLKEQVLREEIQTKYHQLLDTFQQEQTNHEQNQKDLTEIYQLNQQLAIQEKRLEKMLTDNHQLSQQVTNLTNDKQHLTSKMEEMELKQNETEEIIRNSKRDLRSMERELKKFQTLSKEKEEEQEALKRLVDSYEKKIEDQKQKIEIAFQKGYEQAQQETKVQIKDVLMEKQKLQDLYTQELVQRRKLHNCLMELQGNIRVFCRVRPIQAVELKTEQYASLAIFFKENDKESLELVVGENLERSTSSSQTQKHNFEFDHVFQPNSSQIEVFDQTKALVMSALDGFNVCIFAYGQTGSGKTHTMEGNENDPGITYRSLVELFRIRDERMESGNFECTMKLSILEVYNETIVDLLDGGPERKILDVRVGRSGAYVENLLEVEVFNEKDVTDLMRLGHSHRSVGSHDFNEHSSRSHLVMSIHIETLNKAENRRCNSKLHMIDLAGSERVSKTAASGQRLKEAQNINRSLSALGDVIAALGSNSKHVPFRNSKLTFLLQESLSGNSKVLMFVNVSPVQWNAWETLCSLNFASRCRNVSLGQAKINVSSSSSSSLKNNDSGNTSDSSSSNSTRSSGLPSTFKQSATSASSGIRATTTLGAVKGPRHVVSMSSPARASFSTGPPSSTGTTLSPREEE